ncbi:hypothetical protein Lbir_0011 [Legionella birminghamensis]|uniref:Uncharacterized protein n=1 Tax=Legionella birminghamensis TaxID=28083 RepID=A0A378IA10_9GAMM|nr:hypothetical protein [Legionella birminghamensis]KTC75942.1 hypothetical protein Lbir_0011 [Legionella birminghamensis]STX32068.1 Uncharacterised protein [Legionella birminghamensis]
MNRFILGLIPFAVFTTCYADNDVSSISGSKNKNILLYFNGAPEANTGTPAPKWKSFNDWCGTTCFPTTMFPLTDPVTNKTVGTARVWGKDMNISADGDTLCFTEFIEYKLSDGVIYTLGRQAGTCGTFMDATLVPPISVKEPGVEELAGGGDGDIVGGEGKFAKIKGTYNDRVFVEFMNRSTIVYYDALFFNLMISK